MRQGLKETLALSIFFLIPVLTHGQITGKITYDDRVPPPGKGPFKVINMSSDPKCPQDSGAVVGGLALGSDGKGLGEVIVSLKLTTNGNYSAPRNPVVINQTGCMFGPRVAAAMVGQPVSFKNSDGILHNVHGLPKVNREFNIGMPPSLKEKTMTFNKPEPAFKVKCDVHPWQVSYLSVMTHPYFGVTNNNGNFSINTSGLEDGTYEVSFWHEKLGEKVKQVEVAGGKGRINLGYTLPKR